MSLDTIPADLHRVLVGLLDMPSRCRLRRTCRAFYAADPDFRLPGPVQRELDRLAADMDWYGTSIREIRILAQHWMPVCNQPLLYVAMNNGRLTTKPAFWLRDHIYPFWTWILGAEDVAWSLEFTSDLTTGSHFAEFKLDGSVASLSFTDPNFVSYRFAPWDKALDGIFQEHPWLKRFLGEAMEK